MKYIIVRTLCNDLNIANQIIDALLDKRLVAGSQMSVVDSKYWWNNKIEESKEYKLEFRTIESNFKKIEEIIKSIHNYEVCEISYIEITGANKEFFDWIDENIRAIQRI